MHKLRKIAYFMMILIAFLMIVFSIARAQRFPQFPPPTPSSISTIYFTTTIPFQWTTTITIVAPTVETTIPITVIPEKQ